MDDLKIGRIITQERSRDAVHVAVAPVIAGERLGPGEHVWVDVDTAYLESRAKEKAIGIVDPFLRAEVRAGERFWLFLYPGSITSLRHDWTHPALPAGQSIQELLRGMGTLQIGMAHSAVLAVAALHPSTGSQQWMNDYAAEVGLPVKELLDRVENFLSAGEYLEEGGRWESQKLPEEFWDHFERVTGKTVAADKREYFFSCSC